MMLKQSSSRNQKGKGFSRVKLALQLCLLLAICIWLVYQAKQFSNQRATLVGSSDKEAFQEGQNEYQMLKLGRKNLDPRLDNLARETSEDAETKLGDNEEDETESAVENDETSLSIQDKIEEGEHEQLEDLIDEDDSED